MDKPNLSELRIETRWYQDMWSAIKNATMTTIGKDKGKYPDSEWKRSLLMAEHSPIRIGHIISKIYRAPQFVHGHLVRHHVGVTPFISTLRADRNNYDETPNRNTLQEGEYDYNFQSLIDISKKRLCNCASKETRETWKKVKEKVAEVEPELAECMVRECVYRNGLCPEMFTCNYIHTKEFEEELKRYTKFLNDRNQICEKTNINK